MPSLEEKMQSVGIRPTGGPGGLSLEDKMKSIGMTPQQPQTDDGILGNIKKGFVSGGAGVYGGIADILHLDGAGDYMQDVVHNNQRQKEFDSVLDADYWLDPSGAVYDVANAAGSMAAIAPAALALPESAAASGAAGLATLLGRAGLGRAATWAGSQAGKSALGLGMRGAATGIPEALAEGGMVRREAIENGLDDADLRAWETAAMNLPTLMLSNAAEYMLLGGGALRPTAKAGEGLATRVAKAPFRAAPAVGVNAAQNAGEELLQQTYSDAIMDRDWGNPLNPYAWTEDQRKAFEVGGVAGGLLSGGPGAVRASQNVPIYDTGHGDIDRIVSDAARRYDLSPEFLHKVIQQESGYNPEAVSNAGAQGLMQLMPDTAKELGVENSLDPEQNIFGGAKYLRQLLDSYEGDERKALAAYNAGPGNIEAGYGYADEVLGRKAGGNNQGNVITRRNTSGEGKTWIRQGDNVKLDGAQDETLEALELLADWFYERTGKPLVLTSGTNGNHPSNGSTYGHDAGWKIDINDWGSGAEGQLVNPETNMIDGPLAEEFIAYGKSLGLGMNKEQEGTNNVHLDVSAAGDQWTEGTNMGGLKLGQTRIPNQQTPSSTGQQRQEPVDTQEDEMNALYEGFIREQLQASQKQEDKDFFGGFFDKEGNFNPTEENISKIEGRIKDDLAEDFEKYAEEHGRIDTKTAPIGKVKELLTNAKSEAANNGDWETVSTISKTQATGNEQEIRNLAEKFLPASRTQSAALRTQSTTSQNQPQATSVQQNANQRNQNYTTSRDWHSDYIESDGKKQYIAGTFRNRDLTDSYTPEQIQKLAEVAKGFHGTLTDYKGGTVLAFDSKKNANAFVKEMNRQTDGGSQEHPMFQQTPVRESQENSAQNQPQATPVPQQPIQQPEQNQPMQERDAQIIQNAYNTGMGAISTNQKERAKQGKGLIITAREAGVTLPEGMADSLRKGTKKTIQEAQAILANAGITAPPIGGMNNASTETTQTQSQETGNTANQNQNAESGQGKEAQVKQAKALTQFKKNAAKVINDYRNDKISYEEALEKISDMVTRAENAALNGETVREIRKEAMKAIDELERIYDEKTAQEEPTQKAQEPTLDNLLQQARNGQTQNQSQVESAQNQDAQELLRRQQEAMQQLQANQPTAGAEVEDATQNLLQHNQEMLSQETAQNAPESQESTKQEETPAQEENAPQSEPQAREEAPANEGGEKPIQDAPESDVKQAEEKAETKQEKTAEADYELTPAESESIFGNQEENDREMLEALGITEDEAEEEISFGNEFGDTTDEEIEALKQELKKELSKTSANPVFNPRIYSLGLQLGGKYIQKGYRTFKNWFAKMTSDLGEPIEPWAPAIWETLKTYPKGQKFDPKQVMVVSKAIGSRYEGGMTSLEDVQADMKKLLKGKYNSFAPMIEASYNGIKKFFDDREAAQNGEGRKSGETDRGRTTREGGRNQGTETVSQGTDGRAENVSERPRTGEGTDTGLDETQAENGETSSEAGNTGRLRSSVSGETGRQEDETTASGLGQSGRGRGSESVSSSVGRGGRQDTRGTGEGGQRGDSVHAPSERPVDGNQDTGVGTADRPEMVNVENYHIEDADALLGGTPKVRFARNKKAIETFLDIQAEKRNPTQEEKDAMAAFTGWGSFAQELFQGTYENPQPAKGWEKESQWLRDMLSKEEWEAARGTTINAHYTAPVIAKAMWDMARNMGFKGGRVLEPSMGVGNFFGLMPQDLMDNSTLFGVEMDTTTGGMAKLLYPKANIKISPYQDVHVADDTYDFIIGNVPFSGDIRPADRRYNQFNAVLHDYFFLKGIDELRPGGIMMAITSKGTMDKIGRSVRLELAKKAELVDAYRFPTGAFKDYAGTDVVTDVLILKKREKPIVDVSGEEWLGTTLHETDVRNNSTGGNYTYSVNNFFENHPEKVLGEIGFGRASGKAPGLSVTMDADKFQSQLDNMVKNVNGTYEEAHYDNNIRYESNNENDRIGTLQEKNGELYVAQGVDSKPIKASENWKLIGNPKKGETIAARLQELKDLVKLRKAYNLLEDAEKKDAANLEKLRKQLKAIYDEHVSKYCCDKNGNRLMVKYKGYDKNNNKVDMKRPMLLEDTFGLRQFEKANEPSYSSLCALMRKDGTPARILSERVMRAQKKDIKNPTIKEALMIQRNRSMKIDVDEIAKLSKKTKEEVLEELKGYLFKTPNGEYQVRDQYLSGNVRKKMREAKAALADGDKDMESNIKALGKVMPKDIPYYNISVGFGGTWIDMSYYKEFIAHLIGGNANTEKINITRNINGSWKVTFEDTRYNSTAGATTTYGTDNVKFNRLITHALNHTTPVINTKDENGNVVVDITAVNKAAEQIEKMRETFEDWVWKDEARKIKLAHEYNEIMNNTAIPSYDGSFLDMVGMMLTRGDKEFNLRKHQVNAIYRGLVNGSGIYAHEVGTGKTYTMGGLAMEARRFGIAKKPLILAHNANSKTVAKEIQEMYPGAKVLYITGDSANVKRDIMRIKNDDWDVIVLPHSKTDKLTLREETLDALAKDIITQIEDLAKEAAREENVNLESLDLDNPEDIKKIRSQTVKDLVQERLKIIENIRKYAYKASDKDAIPFEDLGIDMIIVDESHDYKKPPIITKMNVKGLQKSTSNMSIQLSFLTQYVQGQNNGKGIHLFTGTPITNTITELYNNMRYVMPNAMKEAGVYNFDDWFNSFAQVTSNIEYSSTGEPESVDRLNAFVNVAELRRMVGQYMDIVFADDMPEFEPRKTASGKTLTSKDLSAEERAYLIDGRDENAAGRPYIQVINEVIPMNEAQKGVLGMFRSYAKTWKDAGRKLRKEIMRKQFPQSPLFTENSMHKAAMDARMYNPNINTSGQESKETRVIKNVLDIYNRYEQSTQCIMMDTGSSDSTLQIPRDEKGYPLEDASFVDDKGKTKFKKENVRTYNLQKGIVEGLVAAGIPRSEIAVVTGSTNAKKKAEIAEKVDRGEIRVVIGSSSTLGTGVNMQTNLKAMHHIDAPWMPGDLLQRIGRMLRQGNKWNTVLEYRYITEKLDGRRWQVLSTKNKFIKMFMKADEDLRVLDGDAVDVSDDETTSGDFEETLSKATGDPRYLRKANLEESLKKLERAKDSFVTGIEEAKYKLSRLKGGLLDQRKSTVEKLGRMADKFAKYRANVKDGIEITIDGTTYTKSEDANKAIARVFLQNDKINKEFLLGQIAGLNLYGIKEDRGYGSERRIRITIDETTIPGFDSADSVAGVLQKMRGINKTLEKEQVKLENAKNDVKTLEKQVSETFPREKVLIAKRKELDDLLKDLEKNPTPPPQWLVESAPVMADVVVDGQNGTVDGYKANPNDTFYVRVKLDGKGVTKLYPWQKVMDNQGLPMITAPEGVKESPDAEEQESAAPEATETDTTSGEAKTETQEETSEQNGTVNFETGSFRHTKTGEMIPQAKLKDGSDSERNKRIATLAKNYGGKWSRYSKSLLFKSEAKRDEFLEAAEALLASTDPNTEDAERQRAEREGGFSNAKHFSIDGKPIVGVRRYSTAWHGSPHKFEFFSLKHVGSGEGYQMRGYGLYFAKDPSIATRYRDRLSQIREWDDVEGWKTKPGKGYLYQVSIPDEELLLDYGKPISKQSQKVQEAIKSIAKGREDIERIIKDDVSGFDFYNNLSDSLGENDEAASKLLNLHGVKGVVYDEGYKRDGDGLCYVVFDDEALKTLMRMESPSNTENSRSIADLKNEVKDAFPGAKVEGDGNTLKLTMPNGQKVTVTLHENITVNEQEEAVAKASHGFDQSASVTIEGYAETVGDAGFIALSQASREGTGFHEAYHIAEAMAFTKKELADAKRLISENEEERANSYAKWKIERKKHANFAKLWQKIADVAAKMAGILGYETKRNIFRKVESGEIYNRSQRQAVNSGKKMAQFSANSETRTSNGSNNQGGSSMPKFSVSASDNSTPSFLQRVKNFLSGTPNNAQAKEMYRRTMARMLEDALGVKIRYGKMNPPKDGSTVVYKENDKVIRSMHAYDWENILPVAGGLIAERLGISKDASSATTAMKNYIADWILTGAANNTSLEARRFQQAMAKSPAFADKLIGLRTKFQDWADKEAREQMQQSVQWSKENSRSLKEWKESLYEQFVEELAPVENLVKKFEQNTGKKLDDVINPMTAFRLFRGSYGKAITMIEGVGKDAVKGLQMNYPNIDFTGFKTLRTILADIGALQDIEKQKDFGTYCIACHMMDMHMANRDLVLEQKKFERWIQEIKDGKRQDGKEKIAEYEENIRKLKEDMYKFPPQFSWENCEKYIKEGRSKYADAQKALVRFSNTTAAILADSGVISFDHYQDLLKKWPNYVPLFRVFEENEKIDFGDSMKELAGSARDIINPIESIIHNTVDFVRKAEKNKAKCLLADLARCEGSGWLIEPVDNGKPNTKTTISFFENGTRKYLETDAAIVEAINNMGRSNSNALLKIVHAVTSIARACFTIASPEFAVRNVFRDYADMAVYNKFGFVSPLDWGRGLIHSINRDSTYYEWLSSGAAMASAVSLDRNYTQEMVDKLNRSWGSRFASKQFGKALLEALQKVGEYSEYATRISMYEKTKSTLRKQQKANIQEAITAAALQSRDLMDFSRHGKAGEMWNKWVPFANASLQGMNKFYRTMLDPQLWKEDKTQMTKAWGRLALSSIIPAMVLFLAHHDEDWYKEAPDWLKETHWLFKLGDTVIRIPKGSDVGIRFLSNAVEKGMAETYDKEKAKAEEYFKPLVDTLPDFFPIILKPITEAMLNKSFFTKRDIVPQSQEKLPAKLQYGPYTTGLSKVVGEALGIAPSKVDHVISGYTGSMGMAIPKAIDLALGSRQLDTAPTELPLIRSITYMPYKNPRSVQKYYELLDEQTKYENEYKMTNQIPQELDPALLSRLKEVKKHMSSLSKEEKSVINDPNLSLEQRKKKQMDIQQRRIRLVNQVLK